MRQKSRSKSSSIFLIELILAILFFSIASAICVQFFVKAHRISVDSQRLSQAVGVCNSIAEICRTSDSADQAKQLLSEEYPFVQEADMLLLSLDTDFQPCSQEQEQISLVLSLTEKEQMLYTQMQVCSCSDQALIYELSLSHHLARRTSYE